MFLRSLFRRKSGKYIPIDDVEAAFSADGQLYEPMGFETIIVFDVPSFVANSPVLNIVDHILAQSQERARSGKWYSPTGPTPQGYARLLVTLQDTTPEDEFEVLQDHLKRCLPSGNLPFTFQRMTVELVY